MSFTTTQYRQELAKRLRAFWTGTSDNVATSTTTMSVAAWPISSTIYSSRLYADWLLMIPSAGAADQVRAIATYAPTPPPALFTVDNPWSGSAVPTNKAFELHAHGFNPAVELLDFINHALRLVLLEVEFTAVPSAVAGAHRTNLSGQASWLTDAGRVLEVGYLFNTESREVVDPYGPGRLVTWRPVADWGYSGGPVFIEHPDQTFDSTQTLYVRAKKAAYYMCNTTGGGPPTPGGLFSETDVCPADRDWVAAGALAVAWDRAPQLMEQAAEQRRVLNERSAVEEFRRYEQAYWRAAKTRRRRPVRPLEWNVPGSRWP